MSTIFKIIGLSIVAVLASVFFLWFLAAVGLFGAIFVVSQLVGVPMKVTQKMPDGSKRVIGHIRRFKFYKV